jgi:hypothetical protein
MFTYAYILFINRLVARIGEMRDRTQQKKKLQDQNFQM